MSRRERISDFTRPDIRSGTGSFRRVGSRSAQRPHVEDVSKSVRKSNNPDIKRSVAKTVPIKPRQNRSNVLQRQGLKKLPPFKPRRIERSHRLRAVGSMAIVIIIVLMVPYLFYKSIAPAKGVVKGVRDSFSSGDATPEYMMSANIMDVAAKIDAIDNVENDIRTVVDFNHLGWYEKGSKPGDPGAILIAGYVTGVTGALREIDRMKVGDQVQIRSKSGELSNYKVVATRKLLPKDVKVEDLLKPLEAGKEGLNIITFINRQDPSSEFATHRYVIYAIKE